MPNTTTNNLQILPSWFRQELPDMAKIREMKKDFRGSNLHTVCESALCPNLGECWGAGVATFMILGEICTRACRFCAVKAGRPQEVDADEPRKVAEAVKQLNLNYVVITSVARDDLEDEGAEHFYQVIKAIRIISPKTKIEVLIPDFSNKEASIKRLIEAKPEVVSHNIETVRCLSEYVRSKAVHDRSLDVLRNFKKFDSSIITKTSFMLGLGESHTDLEQVMDELVAVGVDILTIGQYLKPTDLKRHIPIEKFYTPAEFKFYKELGMSKGFKYVQSGPKVRSSFIAEEGYKECMKILQTVS
ncbi:MAG: lipoic acid synthetase [Candidatus Omnitrophota bacterium]|jgi:lipoic acid synthetase